MPHRWRALGLCGFAALAMGIAYVAQAAEDSSVVKDLFGKPTREYTSAPFWVWNDMLTEDQIRQTMQDMAGQGVKQVFVHPRPGLMTPYMSEEWLKLFGVALDEAKRLDMNVWIYDENSYPSGFAGGLVPEAMPESRGLGIDIREDKTPGAVDDSLVAVYKATDGGCQNITDAVKGGQAMPEGKYYVVRLKLAPQGPWFGGKNFVDLLRPGVAEKFLEVTLEPYRKQFGDEFGKRIPGSFTDEPHLCPAGGFHWTPDLPEAFQARWGYSLMDNLPSLSFDVGDWQRVRHNYYQLLHELFVERWAKPYYAYCAKNNLEFTGHYWEHDWPGIVPDNMGMAAWQHRPGIDILFNQYSEGVGAQVGNVRAVVELASVANQMGRKRTLCETYGGSGWDARFEDLKRIGDWVYVLGVNTLNEHLSHITLRGARKRDYPIVFSYHAPWWGEYHVLEEYFTRLTVALSHGEQRNPILVMEPTTTIWMFQSTHRDQYDAWREEFQKFVTDLAKAQVEFDIGSEDILARNGSVQGKGLVVGQRTYDTVVLPPHMLNLNAKTAELLEAYLKAGGTVLSCEGTAPTLLDGQASDRGQALAKNAGWKANAMGEVKALASKDGFAIRRAQGDKGLLYHMRRILDDGQILFLVNTSMDEATKASIESTAGSVQQWNLETGAIGAYPFAKRDKGVACEIELAPCGSLLLFLANAPADPPEATAAAKSVKIRAASSITAKRVQPNVLTLDYVDVKAGGEAKEGLYVENAGHFVFQKHGFNKNPWEGAVQFRDELIKHTFPPDSGFEAAYRFTIADGVPADLAIVIERADLYTITCNGKPVKAEKGAWWLDRAFGKIDIHEAANVGENVIALKAQPFTMFHEIEAAYLLGDFSLTTGDKGFVVHPAQVLRLGPWNAQGAPFYGAEATYTARFDVAEKAGRYVVSLPAWYGAVAKVAVNGKQAGHIYRQPFECDVTDLLEQGANTVEVTIFGTPRNTLGPLHNDAPLGIASPGAFRGPEVGPPPGDEYGSVAYGLFEPFFLVQR